MNPNENNPVSPAGAGGALGATPSSPVNPLSVGPSTNDGLASAKDNLTSAGQAVANNAPNTMGIDQLGSNNPSASMEVPTEPLTPADPVPGSIGSVKSVPPVKTTDDNASTFTAPTTSAMPVMGGGDTANNTATSASASSTGYFNPFANGATSAQSSATAPATLQQNGKVNSNFGMQKTPKAKGSMSGIVMIIAWAIAIVAAILAVFFFIQWQDAEDRASKKEIVYIPAQEPDTDTGNTDERVSQIICTQYLEGDGIEGVEGVVDHSRTMFATYVGEGRNYGLDLLELNESYGFVDNQAAEAARWYFDGQVDALNELAAMSGVNVLDAEISVTDNSLHYNVSGDAARLVGENANRMMLNFDENGNALLDPENVQRTFEEKGFICIAE